MAKNTTPSAFTEAVSEVASTEKLQAEPDAKVAQTDKATKKEMVKVYLDENKDDVIISPLYAPYFGQVMTVMINGISVHIPCDGRSYKVPHTFASEVHARIMAIDAIKMRAERMADVVKNKEQYPGELSLA